MGGGPCQQRILKAILGSFLRGGKQPIPKLPLPFHPWNSPFWGESGTNTNFWLPTVSCRPCFGVFFAPFWLSEAPLAGAGPAGAAKNTHETPPPNTPCQFFFVFWGGKAAESVKAPDGRGFPPVLGGIWGREVPTCHVRAGPRAPPASRRPKMAENAPNPPPFPPPPARVPGGLRVGEGRARYLPPPNLGGGGFASNLRFPPPPLARSYTYSFWG